MLQRDRHPCFDDAARHTYGRVHLPVAPQCNIQCNFCNRKCDCVAESRPGVTSTVLSPGQALAYLEHVVTQRPEISVVGIAGPGDPFAAADVTLETLRLVRERFPEMLLCVASNGLAVPKYLDQLAELAISHMTVTINAVDQTIGAGIYAWVRDGRAIYRGMVGAKVLLDRQLEAVQGLKARGITVKVNTIVIPGVNDHHVVEVARTVAALGADVLNCVPLYPVEGTEFADIPSPDCTLMESIRAEASQCIPQMRHCTRCRADAVGLLGETQSPDAFALLRDMAVLPLQPNEDRPYIAVASQEGVLINQHLGEARELRIFSTTADGVRQVATRTAPPSGGGDERWRTLAQLLQDCRAILVHRVGETPRRILEQSGIRVYEAEGLIDTTIHAFNSGRRIPVPVEKRLSCAAGGCTGSGTGCG